MHGVSKQTHPMPLQSGNLARLWKPGMLNNVVAPVVRQLPAAAFCHCCILGGRNALGALFAADPAALYLCVLSTCGTPHTAGLAPDVSFLALMCSTSPVKPRLEPLPCRVNLSMRAFNLCLAHTLQASPLESSLLALMCLTPMVMPTLQPSSRESTGRWQTRPSTTSLSSI